MNRHEFLACHFPFPIQEAPVYLWRILACGAVPGALQAGAILRIADRLTALLEDEQGQRGRTTLRFEAGAEHKVQRLPKMHY
jgi:hypothetical protein